MSRDLAGPLAAAEALFYEPARWPSWIDGFGHVLTLDGAWPEVGAVLKWESRPGGRGQVQERVTEYEPGAGQTLAVEDGSMTATQRVRFEALADGVSVTVELDYSLRERSPASALVDRLFIRRALRDSLRRTLERFDVELTADRELLR